MTDRYVSISPTAKLTALLRAETDIPYSKEIADKCNTNSTVEEVFGITTDGLVWMAAMLELRYKSLSECLKRTMKEKNISQVLELAAGIVPRGILMSENPEIRYIETDLPEMSEEKKKLVIEINSSLSARENYIITPLSAVNAVEFSNIGKLFNKDGVAVINEGLLSYLTVEEKGMVAKNIHDFLTTQGGIWITTDISNGERMRKITEIFPDAARVNQKIQDFTGKDMRANGIGGGKEGGLDFYRSFGFTITEHRAFDLVDHLVSLDSISDESIKDRLKEALDTSRAWVLEVI
jgi:O-methyltransferase involved in polyketide biosynthesis